MGMSVRCIMVNVLMALIVVLFNMVEVTVVIATMIKVMVVVIMRRIVMAIAPIVLSVLTMVSVAMIVLSMVSIAVIVLSMVSIVVIEIAMMSVISIVTVITIVTTIAMLSVVTMETSVVRPVMIWSVMERPIVVRSLVVLSLVVWSFVVWPLMVMCLVMAAIPVIWVQVELAPVDVHVLADVVVVVQIFVPIVSMLWLPVVRVQLMLDEGVLMINWRMVDWILVVRGSNVMSNFVMRGLVVRRNCMQGNSCVVSLSLMMCDRLFMLCSWGLLLDNGLDLSTSGLFGFSVSLADRVSVVGEDIVVQVGSHRSNIEDKDIGEIMTGVEPVVDFPVVVEPVYDMVDV